MRKGFNSRIVAAEVTRLSRSNCERRTKIRASLPRLLQLVGSYVPDSAVPSGLDCRPRNPKLEHWAIFKSSFGRNLLALVALCFVSVLAATQSASAHGELLIRIAGLSRQIATNPAPQLYLGRGELYREDKNWEAAESDYALAAKLGVPIDSVDFCRAQLRADLGRWEAAKTILDSMLLRSPENGKALLSRAHVLVRLGARPAALADFEKGFKLVVEPEAESFLERAQTLVAEGQVPNALEILDAGVAKYGPMSALQVYAVDLEMSQTNMIMSLARLQTIVEHADRKERWLIRRGEIQFAAGKTSEAQQSYQEALAAIRHLPSVLQRSPPTMALQSQINMALAQIGASAAVGRILDR